MSEAECLSCRKRPGIYQCIHCENPVCKPCSEVIGDANFITLEKIPTELAEGRYCGQCFDNEMAPRLDAFRETLEKAKEVFIFFKTQKKHIPLIKKSKILISIPESPDRDELILHLAYYAAKEDYNAVIEVDVSAKKVKDGGSNKTAIWKGSGYGALVDGAKIERQDFREQIYR